MADKNAPVVAVWLAGLILAAGPALAVDYPVPIHRGNGLANVFGKLKAGQSAKIAYIGGSVTQNPGWRDNVTNWFKGKYPGKITEINAGWSGTGSLIGAMRYARDVLASSPDLVFIEFAVNDLPEDPLFFIERNCEGMVRQTWTTNPAIDICFIETIRSDTMVGVYLGGQYPNTIQAHYNICDHYAIPSVNVGWAVYKHVLAGTPWSTYFPDVVHPNATGSAVYSNEAVIPYLESERTRSSTAQNHSLPSPRTDYPVLSSSITEMVNVAGLSGAWTKLYNQYGVPSLIQTTTAGATVSVQFTGPAAAAKVSVAGSGAVMSYSFDGSPFYPANLSINGFDYLWAFPTAKTLSTGGTHTLTLRADSGTVRIVNVESAKSTPVVPPQGTNLALTAIANPVDSMYSASFDGAKARDGNNSTKWTSTDTSSTHWLAYDLGATCNINSFVVRHASEGGEETFYNTKAFTIQSAASLSGPWTTEFTGNNSGQAGTSTFNYASPKSLRYVRLHITECGVDNYARIPEFEVWGVVAPPAAPVAEFVADTTSGMAPLTVNFTDQSTGQITSRSWAFGDGGTSTATNPSHTFQNAGSYTVALTVNGPGGNNTRTRTNYISVQSAPQFAPVDFDKDGDVDQSDFGRFQACYSGSGNPQSDPACAAARLDLDTDVDLDDFGIFQQCFSGPGQPANPNCAG